MFALISLVALAASTAHAPHHAKKPEPTGTMQGLISADDYPAEALDHGEQGTVGILLRVDTAGLVSDCVVEKSSGSTALDAQTCRVVRERAKFQPALDRHGNPIPSETRSTITWRIAEGLPQASDPWRTKLVMSYGPDEQPSSCQLDMDGAVKPPAGSTPRCTSMPLPERIKQLGQVSTMTIEQELAFGPIAPPALAKDDVLIGRYVLALSLDKAGKVDSCNIIDANGQARGADLCKSMSGKTFTPHKGMNGQPVPIQVNYASTILVHLDKAAPATPAQ